jgi:signal transduction histidine kinase
MTVDTDMPAAPAGLAYHGKFLLLVLLVSSMIAVLLTLMEEAGYAALPSELLVSNTIGLCIWLTAEAIQKVGRGRLGVLPGVIIAIPLGIVGGSKLATVFGARDLIGIWTHDPISSWKSISVSLLFAVGASAYIIQHTITNNYRLELEGERRRSAEASRSQAVAELALLQAQIEPHFLFNTLAHVQSAIEQEPAVGKAMLQHLIRYLRGALLRSRQSNCKLVEEQELVEPLLAIAAIRLGARLRYHVVIPDALRDAKMPPLLLQPLVENAIKHGIEPAVAGGEIRVQGELDDGALVLRVSDTGVGMSETAPEGVGLANVRARLGSLYGSKGRLTLQRNPVGGTIAELRLPWERLE